MAGYLAPLCVALPSRVTESLVVEERDDPIPGARRSARAGSGRGAERGRLDPAQGLYPAPPGSPPDIPGMEFAGEVAALGDERDAVRGR